MDSALETPTVDAVAVLGAGGTMGKGIARNAAAAEIKVRAWNRTASKREDLAGAAAGSEGAVWMQMGTIGVEGTARCAELARDRGLEYVDAPVLGTKKPAEEGQLVVLAPGPERPRDRLEPFFDAIGKRTIWLGGAGQGSQLKEVVNGWLCSVVEGTAEMLRLAAALGLEPRLALDAIEDGPLDSPYVRLKGNAMLSGDFITPSFRLALAAKDARLAVDAGREAGAEIPVLEAIAAQVEAVAAAHPDDDIAALFLGTDDD